MRRGSVSTWEPWARRNSANMAQFSSNRQEFTTCEPGMDGIEYQREGGFFLSHRKLAIVITSIFLLLVAAGFIGAYAGALPHKKFFDTTALIAEDVGSEPADAAKYVLSPLVSPLRYHVGLMPIVEDNAVSRVRGRVIIEFFHNGTEILKEILLNAKSMNITRARLLTGLQNWTSLYEQDDWDSSFKHYFRLKLTDGGNNLNSSAAEKTLNKSVSSNRTSVNSSVTPSTLEDLSVSRRSVASLNESVAAIAAINIVKSVVDEQHGVLTLTPAAGLKSGGHFLEIDYEARVDNRTLQVANYSDGRAQRWLMASRLKPINARRLFPVFDDVKLKAHFTFSIIHPKDMIVLTNVPLNSSSDLTDDWIIDTFVETSNISPHSLALVQGQLLVVDNTTGGGNHVPIRFFSERGDAVKPSYLKQTVLAVIKHFEDFFSMAFPMPKLDIVSVPFAEHSGSPGLITIKQNLFNVTNESPGITKYNALETLIRLVGRQWLGGLVNSRNWTDVWIIESSLIDLQHTIIQKIDPTFNHSTFLLDVQLEAFEADGYSVSQSLRSKVNPTYLDAFHPDELYARGACLLRMLHDVLKANHSRTGYRKLVSRWAYGNVDVESFLEVMSNGSSVLPHGTSITQALESWINGHGYPVVNIRRDYTTGKATISQSHFKFDDVSKTNEGGPWHIPLTWVSAENNWTSPSFAWLSPADKEITLDNVSLPENKSWVIFNSESLGYFRVNYDDENWRLIAEVLQDSPEIFSPAVRASLVDNVLSLAFVRVTSFSTAFSVINYLINETQPEPWSALMRHAFKLDLVLYDTSVYPKYQEYMRKLTSNLFAEVGTQVETGNRMTLIAHQLGSAFEDPAYVNWAKKNYENLKTSVTWEKRHSVPSYLRETLLCTFAKLEEQLGWQWWQQKLGNITRRDADRNSFLSSLACFQVSWILQAVLNEIVKGDLFEEEDALVILKAFDKHPMSAEVAFKFVQKNWADILKKFQKLYPVLRAFVGSVGSGFTSEKDLTDFQNFRDSNYESLKPVGYITAFVEAKGTSWLTFLNNSLSDFEKTINRLN